MENVVTSKKQVYGFDLYMFTRPSMVRSIMYKNGLVPFIDNKCSLHGFLGGIISTQLHNDSLTKNICYIQYIYSTK